MLVESGSEYGIGCAATRHDGFGSCGRADEPQPFRSDELTIRSPSGANKFGQRCLERVWDIASALGTGEKLGPKRSRLLRGRLQPTWYAVLRRLGGQVEERLKSGSLFVDCYPY